MQREIKKNLKDKLYTRKKVKIYSRLNNVQIMNFIKKANIEIFFICLYLTLLRCFEYLPLLMYSSIFVQFVRKLLAEENQQVT